MARKYDYPYPGDKGAELLGARLAGPWMKPYLVARGLTNAAAQRSLAKHLIREFNVMLADLAETTPQFRYLKTPGTLKKNEWSDKIHPTTSGFGKIAAHFRTALRETFPGYPVS